nr:cupin domain-containing protein [uncultured Flavobacterium sp.]
MKLFQLALVAIVTFFTFKASAQKGNEVNHFSMDTLKYEKMMDKVERKYAYGSMGMIAYFKLEKGAHIPKHKHPNEQITHILEGKVKVAINGVEYIVKKGDVLIIPPNIEHEFWALEDTLDMDMFAPLRMDWLNKTETYFGDKK